MVLVILFINFQFWCRTSD